MNSFLSDHQFTNISIALSDQKRYQILKEIGASKAPLPYKALLDSQNVSSTTISHDLNELENAGLIQFICDGTNMSLKLQTKIFQAYLNQFSDMTQLIPEKLINKCQMM